MLVDIIDHVHKMKSRESVSVQQSRLEQVQEGGWLSSLMENQADITVVFPFLVLLKAPGAYF